MTKIGNSEKTEVELLVYGKEFKDSLLSEIYKLSSELDWTMFPKSMSKDFTKRDVLLWCLTSRAFKHAQKSELFINFSAKISKLSDLLKSEGYQKQTRDREIAELESYHKNAYYNQPQPLQYTTEEIEQNRLNISVEYPQEDTLKKQLEALQKIYLDSPTATIERNYDYEVIVIGKESFENAQNRLNNAARKIYVRDIERHERYAFLRSKYPEVIL
jgi:hypothetical protein